MQAGVDRFECFRAGAEFANGNCIERALLGAEHIVQILDPEADREFLERAGLPYAKGSNEPARAFVSRGKESYAETSDALRLPALMTRLERGS